MIESQSEETLDQVRWIFPVYLILSAIFIVPLALAGKLLLPDSTLTDSYILNIPLLKGEVFIAIIALFGTFSAVIGMLIVSVLTISIMISNEVITPFLLKSGHLNNKNFDQFSSFLLNARRIIISIVFLCGYLMYKSSATHYSLASFGILAFGALAQFSPALIGGIYWIHGNRKGVFLGLIVGFTIWSNSFIHTIFVFEPTKHDISNSNLKIAITALLANILCYILGSLWTKARLVERIQASKFVSPGVMRQVNRTISQISQQDLYLITSRFIDPDLVYKTMTSFDSNFEINTKLASIELIAHTEHMIAKVLGTSSAALVIDSISLGRDLALDEVLNLMNEASSKINLTQEMLIAAIENANEAISIVDKNLNLVAWNHKYEELYEYPDNFLQIGMPIAKVILFNAQRGYCGPGDNNQLVTKRIQHLRNGTSHTSERQLSNGKVIKINGNPMPGGGFVVTFNDITQYRQQEHALREINETLEERVDNRTLELAKLNSQLIQAKEQEEKANASKSRFLAAVGHDLMQPLNAARLFTASLSQHPNLDQDARTTLNHANNSLKIAGELLIDLLDISKLDSNLTTANKQHFALSDILDSSVAEFKAMSGDSQIQFKCIPTKVIVYSDPHLLRRVIQNFLTNAFRYAKGARVLLGIRRRLDNIEIQVLDTGCGIAKTDLNEIFKEFKRLDNPKSQAVSGLGLGLAIADRISKVLNHTINVQSIHGKGSVFSITVPRSKQQNTIPSPSTAKLLNPLTGVKVLAIDNEESILNGLESLLTRWHCEVICAQDLASAKIKLGLKGVAPDIILADYHLDDDKNGLDAMDEIRKTYGAIPGILITADTQKVIIDEASTRNYSYMQKMIKPASLKMLIASLITKT